MLTGVEYMELMASLNRSYTTTVIIVICDTTIKNSDIASDLSTIRKRFDKFFTFYS